MTAGAIIAAAVVACFIVVVIAAFHVAKGYDSFAADTRDWRDW